MRKCLRPLIGEVPYEILQKYGNKIAEIMEEYAGNTGLVGGLIGGFFGVILGAIISIILGG